jgi:hypothetical protein
MSHQTDQLALPNQQRPTSWVFDTYAYGFSRSAGSRVLLVTLLYESIDVVSNGIEDLGALQTDILDLYAHLFFLVTNARFMSSSVAISAGCAGTAMSSLPDIPSSSATSASHMSTATLSLPSDLLNAASCG